MLGAFALLGRRPELLWHREERGNGDLKSVQRQGHAGRWRVDGINTLRFSAGRFATISRCFAYPESAFLQFSVIFVAGFDSRQLHQRWLDRAMSPGQVSFPINHAVPSQAAFTWAEAFIYYIDHLPQAEEFGEST